METFLVYWFLSGITILIGGMIILAVYKGYCEVKKKYLSPSDEETILMGILMIAALPVTLLLGVFIGICHLPYLIGRFIGKRF